MVFTKWYGLVLGSLLFTTIASILVDSAYAQEGQYLNRRVEIWGLFYKLMTAAFIVGAVVNGVILYIAIRFREKKVKREATV